MAALDYGFVADSLVLLAEIDEGENVDYARLVESAAECRILHLRGRRDAILRALWEASEHGTLTVRKYRVASLTGLPLTPDEDAALLASGVVTEVPGNGGPSSYRFAVTADDISAYSVGETWSPEIEALSEILN